MISVDTYGMHGISPTQALTTLRRKGETWELGYNEPSSNNLLVAIGDILIHGHTFTL